MWCCRSRGRGRMRACCSFSSGASGPGRALPALENISGSGKPRPLSCRLSSSCAGRMNCSEG